MSVIKNCISQLSQLSQLSQAAGLIVIVCLFQSTAFAEERERIAPPRALTAEQAKVAEANYNKYCVLCHGKDREGHANDHAPSLRSKSLFESGVPHGILRPLSYGREGTAMGGYLDEVGGPMTLDEIWDLTYWLFWQSGVDRLKFSEDEIPGDIEQGQKIYRDNCVACHGENGEGITAPAIFNPSFLAHNKDDFIRYAIEQGRQDTPMPAFKGKLSDNDIDNVTAYIRSQASNSMTEKPILIALPTPENYIINPEGEDPNFTLKDEIFISSSELFTALKENKKMVLLDTRVTSVWQRAHIEGSIPLPYYTDLDEVVKDLPTDVQIIGYCSCPRAAAVYTINKLRQKGFNNTAVLWEGIFGWMKQGYPVIRAEGIAASEHEKTQSH